jgi:glycosyltransferase involved in cell wall biosynthesis
MADASVSKKGWRVVPPVPFGPRAPLRFRIPQVLSQRSASLLWKFGYRDARIASYAFHAATAWLSRRAIATPADLYIGHYVASLPAVAAAARYNNSAYAFDAEDFHPGEFGDPSVAGATPHLVDTIERACLPGCSYISAASDGISDAYLRAYQLPVKPTVVLNVFPRDEAPVRATRAGSAQPSPSVYWFSQTVGPDRGLETAVRALSITKSKAHLFLRGNALPSFREKLIELSKIVGVAERLHFLPMSTPNEMVRLSSAFDLGLVSETGHTENRRIALTNKLFTYLLAGVPAILSDIPAHAAIAEKAKTCISFYSSEDAQSLALSIDHYLLDAGCLARARQDAFDTGQSVLNWDVEQAKLVACVKAVIG